MKLRVFAMGLMLILAACGGGGAGSAEDSADSGGAGQEEMDEAAALSDDAAVGSRGAVGGRGALGLAGATEASGADGDAPAAEGSADPAQEPLPAAAPLRTGDRIIKEGTITIEVERDGFDQAYTAVVGAARRYQGDVVGSTTRTSDNGDTFGSVTVRVPVRSFEDLVVGVGEIGTIRNRDIDSQDVTSEFTDLESRLRHLRAQEGFYLGLLERARGVRDAIAVQQQLDRIQAQIEQIQGRLNVLEDRTAFSTLTIELFEPGAGSAIAARDEPEARPTIARYWDTARDAFVNVIGAMLVAVLFALPLLIVAGALWFGYRTLVRPTRRPAAVDTPREEREAVTAEQ